MPKAETDYKEKIFHEKLEEAFRRSSGQKLIRLYFSFTGISDQCAEVIASKIEDNITFTSIDLSSNKLSYQGIQTIVSAFERNSILTSINLSSNQISYQGAQTIASALKRNSILTSINLSSNQISDQGAQAIASALEKNSTLTSINLSQNQISDQGAQAIASAFEKNSTLTSINLSGNQISVQGAQAIASALEKNSTLTSIDLSHNQISDQGAQAIASTLEKNSTITSISLSHNQISDQGAQAIASALEKNSTLTSINLWYNQISDQGTQAIVSALEKNTTLTSIDLSGNQISYQGIQAIVSILEKNTTLTSIHLSSNQISYQGIQAIASALEKNSTLTSIHLFNNQISDQGAQAIASTLEKNSTLTSIHLPHNQISDQGAQAIASALEKNSTLTSIDLSMNKISYQIFKTTIISALNRNKKIRDILHPTLESLQRILDINECPNTKEEFNEISKRYLNIKEALNEIKLLHSSFNQWNQIQETCVDIAAKYPWLIEPEAAFELFTELNEEQKISNKNQNSLETIALSYYAEIITHTDYSYSTLLRFMLKNWHNKNNNEQIQHLLNQCLYKCINNKEIKTASFAIEPALMLETLALHKDKIPNLVQKIPGVDKMIGAIIHNMKERDTATCKGCIAMVEEVLTAAVTHKNKLQNLLQKIPGASLIIKQQGTQKSKELKQLSDLITEIEAYSNALDTNSSQFAKNKSTALMAIVQTYQKYREAKEPLTKTLDAIKGVVAKNKEIIQQHRSFFKLNLGNRVTSYKMVTDLEEYIEKIQARY